MNDQYSSSINAQLAHDLEELENKARLRLAEAWEVDLNTALMLDFNEDMLSETERAERHRMLLELSGTAAIPRLRLEQIAIASDNETDK